MQAHGQDPLFGGGGPADVELGPLAPISIEEHPKDLLLAQEKEVLGLYVSDHPLLGVEGLLGRMTDASIATLGDRPPGDVVTVGGLVAGMQKRVTKRGDIMVTLALEDVAGAAVEVVVFARLYEQSAALLRSDAILLVKGRVDIDVRDESAKLMAMELHEPKLGDRGPLVINMPADSCTPNTVDRLKEVLASHPGSTQVFLHLGTDRRTTVLRLDSRFAVDTRNGLFAELKELLGPAALIG
jgi:DNA polymerase-3 subunit alpha